MSKNCNHPLIQSAEVVADVQVMNLMARSQHLKKRTVSDYSFPLVEDIGVEPMTLCVQGRCSSQLS